MKPRLLIIQNRLVVGGPALDIIPLAYHLRDEFEVHILYGRKEADETEPSFMLEKYQGLVLVRIDALQRSPHPVKDFQAYRFIKRYIADFRPQIVHTHGAKVGLFGRLAAARAGIPVIVHTFHGHFFHSYFNRVFSKALVFAERRLLRSTDHVIAISRVQRDELEKLLRITSPSKLKLIPLGVDYIDNGMKDHYKQAFRRTYQVPDGTICIGFLGRLVKIKNPYFFIEVIQKVLDHYSGRNVKFFIVGDGSEKQGMMEALRLKAIPYSESPNHDAPVIFTSWMQNIQNILEGMDMVALTSFNEGTPMSLIEAQLSGKPVVAVDVGGVRDTFLPGESGLLVPPNNLRQFSEALIRLADDPLLRQHMGAKAREFAAASFSKENEIKELKEIYYSYKSANIAAGL